MPTRLWIFRFAVAMLFVMFSGALAAGSDNMLGADSVVRNSLLKKLGNEDDLRSLCSGLKTCLDVDFPGCSAGDKHPWPHLKYNSEFCGVYHEVVKRGFEPKAGVPMAEEVFARLGRRYRAIYENKGTLPMGANVISYSSMPTSVPTIRSSTLAVTAGTLAAATAGAFRASSTGRCRTARARSSVCATSFSGMGMRRSSSGRFTGLPSPFWTWTKPRTSRLSTN